MIYTICFPSDGNNRRWFSIFMHLFDLCLVKLMLLILFPFFLLWEEEQWRWRYSWRWKKMIFMQMSGKIMGLYHYNLKTSRKFNQTLDGMLNMIYGLCVSYCWKQEKVIFNSECILLISVCIWLTLFIAFPFF